MNQSPNIDLTILSQASTKIDLNYQGLSFEKWSTFNRNFFEGDILIIDPNIQNRYRKLEESSVYSSIFHLYDNIEAFMRAGGVVILLLGEMSYVENPAEGKHDRSANMSMLLALNMEAKWAGRKHECVSKSDQDSVSDYIKIANQSECYVDYSNSGFEDETVLITRGEHGSVCGSVHKSYEGTGNGTLITLPRPSKLTTRPESWFNAVLQVALPYLPEHISREIVGSEEDQSEPQENPEPSPEMKINKICERFPKVARQLRERYDERDTLQITDEYDVQDLFHALLHLEFDDIRAEEYSPSHAGSASRFDFLLKRKTIGIELKYVGKNGMEKRLKKELSEDKEHYGAHPSCEQLICFIYDPEFAIDNPHGFEDDMSGPTENLETTVVIASG